MNVFSAPLCSLAAAVAARWNGCVRTLCHCFTLCVIYLVSNEKYKFSKQNKTHSKTMKLRHQQRAAEKTEFNEIDLNREGQWIFESQDPRNGLHNMSKEMNKYFIFVAHISGHVVLLLPLADHSVALEEAQALFAVRDDTEKRLKKWIDFAICGPPMCVFLDVKRNTCSHEGMKEYGGLRSIGFERERERETCRCLGLLVKCECIACFSVCVPHCADSLKIQRLVSPHSR